MVTPCHDQPGTLAAVMTAPGCRWLAGTAHPVETN